MGTSYGEMIAGNQPNGTEGIATVKLIFETGGCDKREEQLLGCVIHLSDKDESLRNNLRVNKKKNSEWKYFIFVPWPSLRGPTDLENIPKIEVKLHRFRSKVSGWQIGKEKVLKVEDAESIREIFEKYQNDMYFVIPCDKKKFQKSSFLKKWSSGFSQDSQSTLGQYGFKKETSGNKTLFKYCEFDKKSELEEQGVLLLRSEAEGAKESYVIGYYKKENNRFIPYLLSKDQKPEPKSDEERRPSIACPQSSSSLQNTMKEPEQEPDGASTSPIHPTDDSYERSDGGTIPGSNKSELLTVLLDDNHHSSRQDNEENISYPTQESLTDPDDCYDPLEEIQKNFKDGSNPFNDDLRQKKNVKKYTRFLLYVAKNATRKWEEIGGKLDIPPNELDTLKADHKSEGTAETAYQMLVRWRRRDHKPTLKKLLVALIATDLVEVAQKVPEMLRDSRSRVGEEVTNELFNEITNDVQDDWKFLGRYLGIDEDVILSIKADNSDNIREQTRQMLNKWKQGNGRQATTGYLINALHDVGRSDVVNVVREWIMKKT